MWQKSVDPDQETLSIAGGAYPRLPSRTTYIFWSHHGDDRAPTSTPASARKAKTCIRAEKHVEDARAT
ncbi:hypothetical protein FA95DRAFT_1553572 [Auriscalpium vulgare]|uniref:Uncharacterized protein n=1 Tax=Auriscalpium vulgare TaxID=40419 RepID=A0ACB8S8Y5_9AGAM|nr:hypothetical protein FA95DRAFT_1553572 [Auriscalpium vulgare]